MAQNNDVIWCERERFLKRSDRVSMVVLHSIQFRQGHERVCRLGIRHQRLLQGDQGEPRLPLSLESPSLKVIESCGPPF